MPTLASSNATGALIFVRHGATAPNLAGLRCGGDLDVALTDIGRHQAAQAGLRIRELGLPVGLIVTSDLQRTRETAAIIGRMFEEAEVLIEPAFSERRLGAWNLRSIAETETALAQGKTPPGGESSQQFFDRIEGAVEALAPRLRQRPVLVASKGVARVLREMLGLSRQGLANGEVAQFDLAAVSGRVLQGCAA